MKKIWEGFKSELKVNIILMVVFFLLGIGVFSLYVWVWNNKFSIINCSNGCLIVGAVLFTFSILVLLSRWGTYDTMSYGFHMMGHYIFNANKDRKYSDLIDYKEKKMAARETKGHYYLPILFISLLFLLAAVIFEIIFLVAF